MAAAVSTTPAAVTTEVASTATAAAARARVIASAVVLRVVLRRRRDSAVDSTTMIKGARPCATGPSAESRAAVEGRDCVSANVRVVSARERARLMNALTVSAIGRGPHRRTVRPRRDSSVPAHRRAIPACGTVSAERDRGRRM